MNVIPMIAPMFPDNEPNKNSTLDELGAYAFLKQNEIIARDKMNAEDLWLMGQALTWAIKKTPHGAREQWFKSQGLKKTYVWQARKLYERATLDQVKNVGLTKALRKFKVVAEKKAKPAAAAVPSATIEKVEGISPTPDSNVEATKPTDEADGDEEPTDDLADEEDKELKEYQESIRKLTPKTMAVAIHHALELLRDEISKEEIDQEFQQTLGQIAELAEALKGLNKPTDADEAA